MMTSAVLLISHDYYRCVFVCVFVSFAQSLGGEYSDEELSVVSDTLDFDRSGLCAFADFVRWWCEG